jgi:hypothetical protein
MEKSKVYLKLFDALKQFLPNELILYTIYPYTIIKYIEEYDHHINIHLSNYFLFGSAIDDYKIYIINNNYFLAEYDRDEERIMCRDILPINYNINKEIVSVVTDEHKIYVLYENNNIIIYDKNKYTFINLIRLPDSYNNKQIYAHDIHVHNNKIYIIIGRNTIIIYNTEKCTYITRFNDSKKDSTIIGMAVDNDEIFVASASNIRVFSNHDHKFIYNIQYDEQEAIKDICITENEIYTLNNKNISVYDRQKKIFLRNVDFPPSPSVYVPSYIKILNDKLYVTCCYAICVWNMIPL